MGTNAVDVGGLGGDGCRNGARQTCATCGGYNNIKNFLDKKKGEGESYMDERARITPATTVAILQHYPAYTGVVQGYKSRFENANGHKAGFFGVLGRALPDDMIEKSLLFFSTFCVQ